MAGGRVYSARVVRFRAGVYGNRDKLTPGCQVLLLRLSDGMNANAIVSIPRSRLAEEFHCDPSRVTEWMNQARAAGFLSMVRRARPGVTAVYQGMYVAPKVRESAPLTGVRKPAPIEVRESAPSSMSLGCALTHTQEGVATEAVGTVPRRPATRRSSSDDQSATHSPAPIERSA